MKKASRLFAMFAASFGAAVVGLGATNAVAGARSGAIALSTTLCCGSSSPEVKAAAAAGLTTTIVDPVTWNSMTTADFKKFKLIILGDPRCKAAPAPIRPAARNADTWADAVKGNVIVIGSDPTLHHFVGKNSAGATDLIKNGIAWAASKGPTGAYITLSCYYHAARKGTAVPALSGFGSFSVEGQALGGGCPEAAKVVNTEGALSSVTSARLSHWHCSVHEAFSSFSAKRFEVMAQSPNFSPTAPYILIRG